MALARAAEQGEPGVEPAVAELGDAFIAAVTPDRPGGRRHAEQEYSALVDGARDRAATTEPPSEIVDPGQELKNRVRFEAASNVRPEKVRWAERDWIPLGAATLLAARKGEGKSTICYDRLARATRGELDGDLDGPVNVAIATAEDHWRQVVVPRLLAAGADLKRVYLIDVTDSDGFGRYLELPDDLDHLVPLLEEWDIRMLMVDPLVAHMPVAVDSHKDQHVRRVLAPLARLAERLDLAVLATIHFNKSPGVDALTRIGGSGGFVNAARCVLCSRLTPTTRTVGSSGVRSRTSRLGASVAPTRSRRE